MMLTVSDVLVVCESDVLRGLIGFALGRYGSEIRSAADFDTASATLIQGAPNVAIIDADMPDAASVAHLTAPGTFVIAVNADGHPPTWANAAVPAPFQPSRLYDALEAVFA